MSSLRGGGGSGSDPTLFPRAPDLVRDTQLDTAFVGDRTVHLHDDSSASEDEVEADGDAGNETAGRRRTRSSKRAEYWAWGELLARGGCSDVYLQRCVQGGKKGGNKTRAVKVISLEACDQSSKGKGNQVDYMPELEAIAKFSQKRYSKCFVKLLGWYSDASNLFIAMEYFPLGDLQSYMSDHASMPEAHVREVTYQVLEGLRYMHREGFAHRDVKPGNVLIKAQPPPDGAWWVKISDFGISKRLDSMEQLSTVKGTVSYMAPELFRDGSDSNYQIDHQAADMWSLGEMVFRMLTKSGVFPTYPLLFRYMARPDTFPSHLLQQHNSTTQADSFVRELMRPAPGDRLTSGQALDHEWILPCRVTDVTLAHFQTSGTRPTPVGQAQPSGPTQVDPWATVSSLASSTLPSSNALPLRTGPEMHQPDNNLPRHFRSSGRSPSGTGANVANTTTRFVTDQGLSRAPALAEEAVARKLGPHLSRPLVTEIPSRPPPTQNTDDIARIQANLDALHLDMLRSRRLSENFANSKQDMTRIPYSPANGTGRSPMATSTAGHSHDRRVFPHRNRPGPSALLPAPPSSGSLLPLSSTTPIQRLKAVNYVRCAGLTDFCFTPDSQGLRLFHQTAAHEPFCMTVYNNHISMPVAHPVELSSNTTVECFTVIGSPLNSSSSVLAAIIHRPSEREQTYLEVLGLPDCRRLLSFRMSREVRTLAWSSLVEHHLLDGLAMAGVNLAGATREHVLIWCMRQDTEDHYSIQLVDEIRMPIRTNITLQFSGSGEHLGALTQNNVVEIWSRVAREGQYHWVQSHSVGPPHPRPIISFCLAHDAHYIFNVYDFGWLCKEEVASKQLVWSKPILCSRVAISPNGMYIAAGSKDGVQILHSSGMPVLFLVHNLRTEADRPSLGPSLIRWSPDGRYVAYMRFEGIILWKILP